MNTRQIFIFLRWSCVCVFLYSQFVLFTFNAAAQDPTPLPTPTSASSPTPSPATPTPTPTNVPPGSTPTQTPVTSTPTGRFLEFRVDDDSIAPGECVTFSWIVKGDIAIVEFDEIDDNKDSILVSEEDTQEECPDNDTEYQLTVTWLDGTQDKDKIKVTTDATSSGGDGGSSGGNGGTVAPPGTFIAVTPIPITTTINIATATPIAVANAQGTSSTVAPTGILSAARTLPETGERSPETISTTSLPTRESGHHVNPFSYGVRWLLFIGGMLLLLPSLVIGSLTILKKVN